MKKYVSIDLAVSPSFYSPQDSRRAPGLKTIVDRLFEKKLDVVGIMSCHTGTSGIDYRYSDYMGRLRDLEDDYGIGYDGKRQILKVERKSDNKKLTLLHAQKVRAKEKENLAYLLVLGVNRIIQPGEDIEKTAKDAKNLEGVVLIPDPETRSGASFEETFRLYKRDLVDGVQFSSTSSENYVSQCINKLKTMDLNCKIPLITASNAKSYNDAGTANIQVEKEKIFDEDFNFDKFLEIIREQDFIFVFRQMSYWRKFYTAQLPVIKSALGHFVAGRKRRSELIKYLFGRKKRIRL